MTATPAAPLPRRSRNPKLDHEGCAKAREQANLSKSAAAAELDISLQYLCDIEAGRRGARPELIGRMVALYDVPRRWIVAAEVA